MTKYSRPAGKAVNVNVRIPSGLIQGIDDYVEDAKFKSRSEFIVTAVRHYLDHMEYMKRHEVYRHVGDDLQSVPASSDGRK